MVLGFNTVRFLITGVAVLQVAQKMPENEIINPENFWRSAFRGAVAAKYFAEQSNYPESNEAYLAGLIREIGQIALIQCAYETYLSVVKAAHDAQVPVVHKEKEILGFTHADVGALLAVKWNLDEGLAGVIAAYPFPSEHPDLTNLHLTAVLHLADRFAALATPTTAHFEDVLAKLDPLVIEYWSQAQAHDLSPESLEVDWQALKSLLDQGNPFI